MGSAPLAQSLYFYKHPVREEAFVENFNNPPGGGVSVWSVTKTPRTVSDITGDGNFKLYALDWSTPTNYQEETPTASNLFNGSTPNYPHINTNGLVSPYDEGRSLRYTLNKTLGTNDRFTLKSKFKIDSSGGDNFHVWMILRDASGDHWFGLRMLQGYSFEFMFEGIYYSLSSSPSLNTWYFLKMEYDGTTDKITLSLLDSSENVLETKSESGHIYTEIGYFFHRTVKSAGGGNFIFDYFQASVYSNIGNDTHYIARATDDFAYQVDEHTDYSPNVIISEADELRYDNYIVGGNYTKFSTNGFYITQDGTSIKVKGTDSSERTYALTGGVWYNIRARFYSLTDKKAMKVIIYDSSGNIVHEFNPVYSTVDNPFSTPTFFSTTGKTGLIDNVEVYR